jgi:hypothetical protein
MLPRIRPLLWRGRAVLLCARPVPLTSLVAILAVAGCGSGAGNGGGGGGSPDYSVSLSTQSLSVASGGSQTVTVTVSPVNGFSGSVSATISGLPTGVTASPASFSITEAGSEQVQLTAASSATAGTSTISISTSSGTLSHSASLQLTVTGAGITLTLQPASLSLIPGVQQQVQLAVNATNGYNQFISGTLTALPAGVTVNSTTFSVFPGGTATFYFTAASGASAGTVQIAAGSGAVAASAQLPITINTTPDFQLTTGANNALGVSQSAYTSFQLSAVGLNGFSQPINVSFTGLPAGVTFSPASFSLQPGGASQSVSVTTTFAAAVASGISIQAVGSSGSLSHQLQLSLTIYSPNLQISIQPSSLTVPAGSTNSFELGVNNATVGTPIGNIQLTITGAPSGVTVSPTSYTSPPQGVGFNVYVQASSNASPGTITATATWGSVTAASTIVIAIAAANQYPSVPESSADWLVQADTLTPYYGFPPPNFTIYHTATQRFFSTEPYLNRLYVTDANTRQLTATLTIPGAFGLDQAPDGSVLYVGTLLGDLYVVDPVQLSIVQRYPSSTISSWGFPANAVYALANGNLLLERYFLVPGFSWVDGDGPLAMWNPQTNDITVFWPSSGGTYGPWPQNNSCLGGVENVILTNNRTRVLLAPIITSEGSSSLCSLDPVADTWVSVSSLSGGSQSQLTTFAVSPDGNTLAGFDGYNIYNLDPATLAVENTIPIPANSTGYVPTPEMLLSQDDSSVFITDSNGADIFDEYNLTTGKLTGWISQVSVASPGSYTPVQPIYQAMSSGGLAAGVVPGGGVGLLDTTAVQPPPVGSHFTETLLAVPYGPVSGGTLTSWLPNTIGVQPPPLGSIYFGTNAATDINSDGFAGYLEAVSPAGTAGPVDVRTFATDGSSQLNPSGFSYGPWVQESLPTYSTADGGGLGDLFGYGFGMPVYGALFIAPPGNLQVTVGGTSATLTGYSPNPYGSTYFTNPIFPSQAIHYTIPPGVSGTSSQIVVSNNAGAGGSTQAMSYLPAVQQYSVSGQLVDGIYDPVRDVYYFSDASQIRVFSLKQNAWLTSIPVPAPQGATTPERLWGLGLSPDDSQLVVADAGSIAVDVIDLNQTSSIQNYPLTARIFGDPLTEVPTGVAITSSGNIYIGTSDLSGDGDVGCGGLVLFDPSATGYLAGVGVTGGGCLSAGSGTVGPFLASSADGSRIYFDDGGTLGFIDTSSGAVTVSSLGNTDLGQDGYEVDLAPTQSTVFIDGFLTDSNVNGIGLQTVDFAESIDADYVYGGAFSADGALFFQPGSQAIDVFDGVTGAFRARVALPIPLSPNFRALVTDNQDSRLIAITGDTGNGIAVIDLTSLPEPSPVSWLSNAASPPAAGNPHIGPAGPSAASQLPFSRMHRKPAVLLPRRVATRGSAGQVLVGDAH